MADPRFHGCVIGLAVSAIYLIASITLGKAINLNPVTWLVKRLVVAERLVHPSYFWGNVAFMAFVFLACAFWTIRLGFSN
jgi:hypothetical protein